MDVLESHRRREAHHEACRAKIREILQHLHDAQKASPGEWFSVLIVENAVHLKHGGLQKLYDWALCADLRTYAELEYRGYGVTTVRIKPHPSTVYACQVWLEKHPPAD
jgi:hypothetical protein